MASIILADDHEIVRDGLRRIVEAEGDMEVVAEAGDADTARRRTSGLKPAVLVLDLNMPGEPSLAIDPGDPRGIAGHGGRRSDYAGRPGLRPRRRSAWERRPSSSSTPPARSWSTRSGRRRGARPTSTRCSGPVSRLSPRVRPAGSPRVRSRCCAWSRPGYTNPEIAEKLVISIRTVETHRAAIHRKLDTSSRAEVGRVRPRARADRRPVGSSGARRVAEAIWGPGCQLRRGAISGSTARTSVPRPGADSISRLPPESVTRSSMPISPKLRSASSPGRSPCRRPRRSPRRSVSARLTVTEMRPGSACLIALLVASWTSR